MLVRDGFKQLRGKRVGLVTNHTGDRATATPRSICCTAPGVKLVALFSPEHGIRGILDADVPAAKTTRRPADPLALRRHRPADRRMLDGIDTLVVDLQDVGARFYTYQLAMGYVMEEAAKRKIAVVVLDRPNPINGWQIEGPPSPAGRRRVAEHFIAYLPMPVRHGMTMGELARLFNEEKKIGADLTVSRMENWRRDAWFDETGLGGSTRRRTCAT